MTYKTNQRGNPEERFWKYTNKKTQKECWIWTGSTNDENYGHIRINKKLIKAHRFSYELHEGKIPVNMIILHKCDNPLCVNPKHLKPGTKKENTKDMYKKERNTNPTNNTIKKLTLTKIKEIKKIHKTKKYTEKEIGKMFNIHRTMVNRIINNKRWIQQTKNIS